MPSLVLGSSSARRQAMFKDLGLEFEIDNPDIDESVLKGENGLDYVRRIAKEKALEVGSRHKGKVVLAADTTVVIGNKILGKPVDLDDAKAMLKLMSGSRQNVISAVCVIDSNGNIHETFSKTRVKIKPLSKHDITSHLSNVENWKGKAGAYGIQSTAGGAIVKSINGSYTGVVGMPLLETINLLRRCNIDI